jgi:hypothetical protein
MSTFEATVMFSTDWEAVMNKSRISKLAQQISQHGLPGRPEISNASMGNVTTKASEQDRETPEMRERRRIAVQKLKTFVKG